MTSEGNAILWLALPKGHMEEGVRQLLADAGIRVRSTARAYRPNISLEAVEAKLMKPQNIVEMLDIGRRDIGFAGADWVEEMELDLVEVLDTELDPVRVVAAAPTSLLQDHRLPARPLTVASEYERLTMRWIERTGCDASFVRSFGATEVFPPEDADLIVDNTATGATLEANGLEIIDTLCLSSTRLYANPKVMKNPVKRERIEAFSLVLQSVLDARKRVMVEVNACTDRLEAVVACLPGMREATVAPLYNNGGYAIKAAVLKAELALVIPAVKTAGGTDVVVSSLSQIVA